MVNLVISALVIWKAITRKCYSVLPAALLVAAYMLARMFELDFIAHAGLAERLILIALLLATVYACWKGGVHGIGVILAGVALVLRYIWRGVAQQIFDAVMYPGTDGAALVAQGGLLRQGFEGVVFLLLLVLQLLMLHRLRKI